jgi:ring-1,2-phenylacetyl-CoA epoxidase subunit PaaC
MNSNLFQYTLRLADNGLILSHRLAEYVSCGPFMEEDLAITNVGLDLLGQAEAFLKYAAQIKGDTDEDALAFGRDEEDYTNFHLVEYPNEDYGFLIARQFLFDAFNHSLYSHLKNSKDATIAAIAAKSLKEVNYHYKRSSEWIIRLGDGTEESSQRIQNCFDLLWMYTHELFEADALDKEMLSQGIGVDLSVIKQEWDKRIVEVFEEATLTIPNVAKHSLVYGKQGGHTEYMGYLLAEMQFLKIRYPKEVW